MALEKRWLAVPQQTISLQGDECGVLQVANANLFRVKQLVKLDDGTTVRNYQVKRVNSANELELGSPANDINDRSDLSAVPPGAILFAEEQPRARISVEDTQRAVYEEDPVVAIRTIPVDKSGNLVTPGKVTLDTNEGEQQQTGDACPDGTVSAHVSVQNDAFTKPWNKLTVTQRQPDGQPAEIRSFKDGAPQEIMTILYFDDGEFQDLEVVDA